MKVSRQEHLKRAFVLTNDDLTAINRTVRDLLRANAMVSYDLKCVDQERQPTDIRHLVYYENGPKKAIKQLAIRGRSEDFERHCSITLNGEFFWSNVRISADGGEKAVDTFFESMQERLVAMSPWYRRLAVIDFLSVFCMLLMFSGGAMTLLGLSILAGNLKSDTFLRVTSEAALAAGSIGVISSIAIMIVGKMLNWLRCLLFPLAVFALGQGVARHHQNDVWRWVVVSTVVIGGIVGICVNLMTYVITG